MMTIWQRIRFLVIPIGILLVFLILRLAGVYINLTPSMPEGFYYLRQDDQPRIGQMVAACVPVDYAVLAKTRGYIGAGHCPGNTALVLKELIALPSDQVEVTAAGLTIDKKRFYAMPRQVVDSKGRPLPAIPLGVYQGWYWLYGSNDSNQSWDSRYFGGVAKISAVAKPILIF